jgi:hypothetical protein
MPVLTTVREPLDDFIPVLISKLLLVLFQFFQSWPEAKNVPLAKFRGKAKMDCRLQTIISNVIRVIKKRKLKHPDNSKSLFSKKQ